MREFKLWTKAEWERNSPSRRDGLDARKERRLAKTCSEYVKTAARSLNMPQVVVATAMTIWHRYFAIRSINKTDRFLVATAALFLAGKIEEAPKALRDLLYMFFKYRFAKNKEMMAKFNDRIVFEEVRELVLLVERLLLCTLGFEFNFRHPYPALLKMWSGIPHLKRLTEKTEPLAPGKLPPGKYVQTSWNFINDSFSGPLCLMYPNDKIAAAAIYAVMSLVGEAHHGADGRPWWTDLHFDTNQEELAEISQEILRSGGYAITKGSGATGTETAGGAGATSLGNSATDTAAAGAVAAGHSAPSDGAAGPPAKRARMALAPVPVPANGATRAVGPEGEHSSGGAAAASHQDASTSAPAHTLPASSAAAAAGNGSAAAPTPALPPAGARLLKRSDTFEDGELEPGEVAA